MLVILPVLAYLIGSGAQIADYAGIIETIGGPALDVDVLVELDTETVVDDGTDVRVITRADFAAAMEMRRMIGDEPF